MTFEKFLLQFPDKKFSLTVEQPSAFGGLSLLKVEVLDTPGYSQYFYCSNNIITPYNGVIRSSS